MLENKWFLKSVFYHLFKKPKPKEKFKSLNMEFCGERLWPVNILPAVDRAKLSCKSTRDFPSGSMGL